MFDFNISSFFGGTSGSSGLFGSFNFSDYRMIKSGSYKKLMKAYYADEKGTKSSSSSSSKDTKSVVDKILEQKHVGNVADTKGISKLKTQADSLKTAAEAFDKEDVFKKEDGSYDLDKITKSLNDFVSKYNSTIDQAATSSSKDVAAQVGYMKNMTSTMSKALEKVGITVGTDGKLSVNEDKLKGSDMKDVKALFSGKYSYAADIAGKATAIGNAAYMSSNIYSSNGTWSSASSNTYNNWV